jgi:hypothetical protein
VSFVLFWLVAGSVVLDACMLIYLIKYPFPLFLFTEIQHTSHLVKSLLLPVMCRVWILTYFQLAKHFGRQCGTIAIHPGTSHNLLMKFALQPHHIFQINPPRVKSLGCRSWMISAAGMRLLNQTGPKTYSS